MKKAFYSAVLGLMAGALFALAGPASAADTIKGTNQNGHYAVVPIEPLAAIKHEAGKLYFRNQFSTTVYHIVDATGTEKSKVLAAWTGNYAVNQYDGWTYNLHKTQVLCNPLASATVIFVLGQTQSPSQSDGCAFWQVANGT